MADQTMISVFWAVIGLSVVSIVPVYLSTNVGRLVKNRASAVLYALLAVLILYCVASYAAEKFPSTRALGESMLASDYTKVSCSNLALTSETSILVERSIFFHGQELTQNTVLVPGKFLAGSDDLFQLAKRSCF